MRGLTIATMLILAWTGSSHAGVTVFEAGPSSDSRQTGEMTINDVLACTFSKGTATSYEAGAFSAKPASALAFRVSKIDLEGQSAELAGLPDGNPVAVRIVRAINANHFLEVVNEGFLNLTTIYDKDPATGIYPAVHSRHFGLLGQPVFAQYSGTCRSE